jgi:hypothetical protein
MGGIDWIHLAYERNQWLALVNTVTNFHIQQNIGKSLS